ncbi:flavin-containing monooxygenase-like protein [Xylogone sp. PMI_703]|nr:flavin-containing monooxygenase-like protein [Xylogone sp. PMI_703]
MCTNQSRHTVAFSGLSWPENASAFPKAWEVGSYLEKYRQTYCDAAELHLGEQVVEASPISGAEAASAGMRWRVKTRKEPSSTTSSSEKGAVDQAEEREYEFDYVIVASGFFGKPNVPSLNGEAYPVIHSSQFRGVENLVLNKDGSRRPGTKIIVAGGQMSGVETAASIALQLSSAAHSPGGSDIKDAADITVHHIVQKPFWVMPLFFPKNPMLEGASGEDTDKLPNPAPSFLPLDLVAYNIGVRPPGPLQNTSGHISPELAQMTATFMQTLIGSDQSEFGAPEIAITEPVRSEPPLLACSDHYLEFVRSGNIKLLKGKLDKFGQSEKATVVDDDGKVSELDDIAAVVLATGFSANESLDFLPESVLSILQYDPSASEFPVALSVHSTLNAKLPTLGFVGFYRSPYWGVMEMQARYLDRLWSGDEHAQKILQEDSTMQAMVELRTDERRAQFPMGDYMYLMESLGDATVVKRRGPEEGKRTGIVFPYQYLSNNANETERKEAETALSIIDDIFRDSAEKGKYVARAVYRALQGVWKVERDLISSISIFPSGKFTGRADFYPRSPTDEGYDSEYLYVEEGEFVTEQGMKFNANRRYAHRYTESTDTHSVWFIKQDNKSVDYLFHELEILPPSPPPSISPEGKVSGSGWRARAHHLCIDDTYDVLYEFRFKSSQLEEWRLEYSVRGPQKDYRIASIYRR